jgi:hypothetical protein
MATMLTNLPNASFHIMKKGGGAQIVIKVEGKKVINPSNTKKNYTIEEFLLNTQNHWQFGPVHYSYFKIR